MIGAPLLIVAALAAAAPAAKPAPVAPVATLTKAGAVTVTLPPSMLLSKEIQKEMTSGLTTAFVILASCGSAEGGARITTRYELWDETYVVRTLDVDGKETTFTVPSVEKLREWWSTAALTVIRQASTPRLTLSVKVLPFSAREQEETQRWLSRVFTSMQSVKDAPVDKRSDPGAAKILDVIVSTSIQRRPLLEFRWTVDAKAER